MDGFLITADHDPFSRNSLARFFSENGFRVAAISNGRECITELAVRGPDVLVIALEISPGRRGGGDRALEWESAPPAANRLLSSAARPREACLRARGGRPQTAPRSLSAAQNCSVASPRRFPAGSARATAMAAHHRGR